LEILDLLGVLPVRKSRIAERVVRREKSKKGDLRSALSSGVTKTGMTGKDRSITPSRKAMYKLSSPGGAISATRVPDWTKRAPRLIPSHPIQMAITAGFLDR
jgi:hypothetical protein